MAVLLPRCSGLMMFLGLIGLISHGILFSTKYFSILPILLMEKADPSIDSDDKRENSNAHTQTLSPIFKPNRSIALIHIGKSGGLTLRSMTGLKCGGIEKCLLKNFGSTNPRAFPLALQTVAYVHMSSLPVVQLQAATSWLIVLRNPIDRVISAYQYSHPGNCKNRVGQERRRDSTKRACTNYRLLQMYLGQQNGTAVATPTTKRQQQESPEQLQDQQQIYRIFHECFPNPDMELFVTSALQKNNRFTSKSCSDLARSALLGLEPMHPISHLVYNYHYYQFNVLQSYTSPPREWLGIRTEHLAHDFASLNRYLGGSDDHGDSSKMKNVTHGSEEYRTASSYQLSPKSYHGLCCMLVDEVTIYLQFIQRMENWVPQTKAATLQDLAEKCGIVTVPPGVTFLLSSTKRGMEDSWAQWNRLWSAWDLWRKTKCRTT